MVQHKLHADVDARSSSSHCQCVCCRVAATVSSNNRRGTGNPAGVPERQQCSSSTAARAAGSAAFAGVPASSKSAAGKCDPAVPAGLAAAVADAPLTATEQAAAKAAKAAAAAVILGHRPQLHSFCTRVAHMTADAVADAYMQGCVASPDAWARNYDCLSGWCSQPNAESLAAAECYVAAGVGELPLPQLESCPDHAAAYQACSVLSEAKEAAAASLRSLQDCEQQLARKFKEESVQLQAARAANAAAACSGSVAKAAATAAAAAKAAADVEAATNGLRRVQGQLQVAAAAVQQYEAACKGAFAQLRSLQRELMQRLAQQHSRITM